MSAKAGQSKGSHSCLRPCWGTDRQRPQDSIQPHSESPLTSPHPPFCEQQPQNRTSNPRQSVEVAHTSQIHNSLSINRTVPSSATYAGRDVQADLRSLPLRLCSQMANHQLLSQIRLSSQLHQTRSCSCRRDRRLHLEMCILPTSNSKDG